MNPVDFTCLKTGKAVKLADPQAVSENYGSDYNRFFAEVVEKHSEECNCGPK